FKSELLDRPINFGEQFKRPSKKTLRKHKAEQGPRMFEAEEIRAMLAGAKQPLKSMIYLGINCGFSNSDIGALPLKALDLANSPTQFARLKPGTIRKGPLWPETVKSLEEWFKVRPEPADAKHADLVYITSARGSWGKDIADNPVSKETRKLLDKLGING